MKVEIVFGEALSDEIKTKEKEFFTLKTKENASSQLKDVEIVEYEFSETANSFIFKIDFSHDLKFA